MQERGRRGLSCNNAGGKKNAESCNNTGGKKNAERWYMLTTQKLLHPDTATTL